MNMNSNTAVDGECTLSVFLLGGFTLKAGSTVLTDDNNRSLKLWSVLAYLLLHRDRSVTQSELIERFWPEDNSNNPLSALKTLLYRIRAMLEPLFPPDFQPILAKRGAYAWNPSVVCQLDTDQFEELCRQGAEDELSEEDRLKQYRQIMDIYRGDLLPKLNDQLWLTSLMVGYRTQYLSAAKEFAALLESKGCFEEMYQVCRQAGQRDPLDEGLYILTIRALLHQGKDTAALSYYEKATNQLCRGLGVCPSRELRGLYTEIMSAARNMETDLEVITDDLRETAARPGAFVCEYGFFREAYRLEARRAMRSGHAVHLCLITMSMPDGSIPPLAMLNAAMDQLQMVLLKGLRRGDVVAKFSGAQFVVLLPSANYENSNMVMERIVQDFYDQRGNVLKLTVGVRQMEMGALR